MLLFIDRLFVSSILLHILNLIFFVVNFHFFLFVLLFDFKILFFFLQHNFPLLCNVNMKLSSLSFQISFNFLLVTLFICSIGYHIFYFLNISTLFINFIVALFDTVLQIFIFIFDSFKSFFLLFLIL